ncbi:arylsulfatase A-like enzyme [Mariniflexile fucanivorans]|uniref:Arylsulfatase A-like enzyme n=1 Tax=Mariniflexile fucanivorans TaxID=264023 RepID=A0A4R1RNH7_9FLAO|nr:arylsulfatase [Mariniflexile fucanivorans]TCL67470.1 arylsulfatase A-like enzyme [Mariniflexile fucanivorans]
MNFLNKNHFFYIVLVLFSTFSFGQKDNKAPNIIFILADDLGYGDVSSLNENSKIKTAHIDKLASQGASFTDAHTSSAVCTPTRYGILTGRYNWRSTLKKGVIQGYSEALIPQDRTTIGKVLQANGYKTAAIGKWHLGWDWANIEAGEDKIDYTKKIKNGPTTLGFDYWFGFCGSLDMAPYVWVENDQPTMVPTKFTSNTGQGMWRNGPTSDDFVHEEILGQITSKSVEYIAENANGDKPFFLYMPLSAPHTPILPTAEFKGKSGLDNPYGDFVLMVDWSVGEIMKALEKQGIADNTIVVFTSDNGCSPQANFKQLATKGHNPSYVYRGTKADIFEGGHRVPFIVRWPSKVKQDKSDQLVCTTDFFASVTDALDIKNGATMAEDSFSFLPALKVKSNATVRESIVHHSINGSFAYRKGDYKAVFCSDSGGWSFPKINTDEAKGLPKFQLYNLKNDIAEKNNLEGSQPQLLELYRKELSLIVKNGRSTIGAKQKNDKPETWPQLNWMRDIK